MKTFSNNQNTSLNPFSVEISEGISIFTAIKNRREMLEKSLPTWLSMDKVDEIIIVDWSSDDGLQQFIQSVNSPKIILAIAPEQPRWILSLAYNLAARLTSRTVLLKMDSDVQIQNNFFENHPLTPGTFYTGNWKTARNDNEKHLHGVSFMYRRDFFAVNGYNECIKTYGWDDIDLYDRLQSENLKRIDLNLDTLHHIEHTNRTSLQDHMKFLRTTNDKEKALLNSLINRFLVESTRSWATENQMMSYAIKSVHPNLITCHQEHEDRNSISQELILLCESSAIVERFYELGVKFSRELLLKLNHGELVDLINLFYERNSSPEKLNLFNTMLKFSAQFDSVKPASEIREKKILDLEEKLKSQTAKSLEQERKAEKLELDLGSAYQNLDNILNSWSWKLGHGFTRMLTSLGSFPIKKTTTEPVSFPPDACKVNLGEEIGAYYGQHRSGWGFAIASLKPLHNNNGIILDSFIERTFQWHPKGVHPHREPWVGFIHVPPRVPDWFASEVSNQTIFASPAWQESLPYCKGLFTLSRYHRKDLESRFGFPVNNLLHPTEAPLMKWSWDKFSANRNRKVVQVGFWLRRLFAIYVLDAPAKFEKVFIRKENVNMDHLLEMERQHSEYRDLITVEKLRSVTTISYLSNLEYDRMLSENIVFIDLYDASANNAVIECITRNTPILVNPIEPVVEYLGERYPFYFSNLSEAEAKLSDSALIKATHKYLLKLPLKKQLTASFFLKSVVNSPIYKSL